MVCLHLYTMTNSTDFLASCLQDYHLDYKQVLKMFDAPLLVDVHLYLYFMQL